MSSPSSIYRKINLDTLASIIIPWVTVREVEVDVEIVGPPSLTFSCLVDTTQPSSKVVILRFKRGMQQGLLARISRESIMEYHAFGIISYVLVRFRERTL